MRPIREQLEIVKGLMGYLYGDEQVDALTTDYIANTLTRWGLTDIRDLSVQTVEETVMRAGAYDFRWGFGPPTPVTVTGYRFISRASGRALTSVFWNSFWSSPDCLNKPVGGANCKTNARAVPIEARGAYRLIVDGGSDQAPYDMGDGAASGGDVWTHANTAGRIGDFAIHVWVKFTDAGIPYFFAEMFNTRGLKFGDALQQLASLVFAASSFVVPGVSAAVANAVFGSLAVTYPALTVALSNVMINTALNGGDVEAAVKNVAAAQLGQAAGSLVQGVSDSQAAGQLAAAATASAARGGDVESAVAMAALRLAPSLASDAADYFTADEAPAIEEIIIPETFSDGGNAALTTGDTDMSTFDVPLVAPQIIEYSMPSLDEIASWGPDPTALDPLYQASIDDGSVPAFAPTFEPLGYSLDDLFANVTGERPVVTPVAADGSGNAVSAAVAETPPAQAVDAPASSFFDDVTWDDTVENLTDLAIAAIRVHQVYQQANRPPVQPAVQTTRAGPAQTARNDGTLTTTDVTTGRIVVTRPPAGVPYELPGGGAVINNGNGTYTTISPTGATSTRSYSTDVPLSGVARVQPETWVPGVPNWSIIAVAAGAFLLATRR